MRIKDGLAHGFWGVGALHFNGARVDLYFEPPAQGRKSECRVCTETIGSGSDNLENPGQLDQVLCVGARTRGSIASFGIKDTVFENNIQHGFHFVTLNLAAWNLKTGEEDTHYIVGVKMPVRDDVSSAFILKQRLIMPPHSWYKWQTHLHVTPEQRKHGHLMPSAGAAKDISDGYEETSSQERGEEQYGGWENLFH
jgi:hypothetical protein